MKIMVEITEKELRQMVYEKLDQMTGCGIQADEIMIEVKSKQNYKSEWEKAEFRARVEINR